MDKLAVPYNFRIKVRHTGQKDDWYEEYVYKEKELEDDKKAKKFFKEMIKNFNADLRGSFPRTLVAVQRKYHVKVKGKMEKRYFNI